MITAFFKPKKRKTSPEETTSEVPSSTTTISSAATGDSHNKKPKKLDASVIGLLQYLPSNDEKENLSSTCTSSSEVSWRKALDKHFSTKEFEKLAEFVTNQRESATVYPPPQDVWSALNLTPLHKVKVVIVGQDPYHGENQGHGLCFSVRKGVQIPPSLRNIYKELQNDPNVPNFKAIPRHGFLEHWARQGVLMLNAVLTVRRGEANSHKNKGWEQVTDEILKVVARDARKNGRGLVYLLWGKPAAKKIESVLGQNNKNQIIISTSHPSPLGATKTKDPFLGSQCFSRANEALQEMGLEPIDWNVDSDGNKLVDV